MTEEVSAGRLYLDVEGDTTGLARSIQRKIDAELRAVKARIKVELDTRDITAQAKAAAAEASRAATVKVKADFDTAGLVAKAKAAAVAASTAATVHMQADADTAVAEARLAAASRARNAPVNADADTGEAEVKLATVARTRTAKINVDTSSVSKFLSTLGSSFMQFGKIPAIVGGVYTLGVAAVQAAGGLFSMAAAGSQALGVLGAIPNLAGIAAQGLGALILGFSGVGAAVKGLSEADTASTASAQASSQARVAAAQQIAAAQDALKAAQENADRTSIAGAQAVADARANLATVQEQAADAVAAAIETQSDAEWALAQANYNSQQAQEALTQAREDAKEKIEDLNRALAQSGLNERAAKLAIKAALQALNDAMADPTASVLEQQQAQLVYEQALANLANVQDANEDLAAEAAQANADGVSGAQSVQDAVHNVSVAVHDQQEAHENLANATENVADTQTEAAQSVADAQQNITDTIASSAQANADAAKAVKQAQQQVAAAMKAAAAAATQMSTATTAATTALDALSPAGQRFAKFIYGLKPRFDKLKAAVQSALLPPLQEGISRGLPLLKTLQTGLVGSAKVIGDLGKRLGTLFGSKAFKKDVGTIMASNNKAMGAFADTGFNLVKILQDLAVAAGPIVNRFAKWTKSLSNTWKETVHTNRETGKLRDFFTKSGDMFSQLGRIFGNIAHAIYGMGKASAPAGRSLLDTFEKVTKKWDDFANSVQGRKVLKEAFDAMVPVVKQIGSALADLVVLVAKLGATGGSALSGFLKTLILIVSGVDKLASLGGGKGGVVIGWILTLVGSAGALAFVGGTILKMASYFATLARWINIARKSMIAQKVASYAMRAATLAWQGAQWLLNAALSANPIGIIIVAIVALVAAFILAWKHSDTFRKIVTAAFDAVRAAVESALGWITNAVRNAIDFIRDHWKLIVSILGGPLAAAVILVITHWNKIKSVIGKALGWIKKVIGFYFGVYKKVFLTYVAIWKKIFTVAWDVLQAVFSKGLEWIKKAIGFYFGGYKKAFILWWTVVRAIFTAAFSWLVDKWRAVWGTLRSLTTSLFGKVRSAISSVLGSIQDSFKSAIKGIRNIWNGLKEVAAKPVEFIVNTVYNHGIRYVWNKIADLVGLDELPEIHFESHRTGGVVGGYRTKSDSKLIAARPGEGLLIPEAVDGLGGERGVNAFNRMFAAYAPGGPIPGGARRGRGMRRFDPRKEPDGVGGLGSFNPIEPVMNTIDDIKDHFLDQGLNWVEGKFEDIVGSIINGFGDSDYMQLVTGSVITMMKGIINYVEDKLGIGGNVPIGVTGGDGHMIIPVHPYTITAGFGPYPTLPGLHTGIDLAGPIGDKIHAAATGKITEALEWTTSYGKHIIINHVSSIQTLYGHMDRLLARAGQTVSQGDVIGERGDTGNTSGPHLHFEVREDGQPENPAPWLFGNKTLPGLITTIAGAVGDTAVKALLRSQAKLRGWGKGNEWAALTQIVSHESGFNPDAQNPTSTAYGLFQFLDSTWASVGGTKTSDPLKQIIYGLRYIAQRYNDPIGAWSFWQNHNWYDTGGMLGTGTRVVTNDTGHPEAVLTNQQWRLVESLIASSRHHLADSPYTRGHGAADGALVGELHLSVGERRDLRPALDEVDFQLRRIRIGGGVHAVNTA